MAVGKFRYQTKQKNGEISVFHFRFNHEAIYEFEKIHGGQAIGHLIPGTISVGLTVELLALSITGLPGKDKSIEAKRKIVLKMLDLATDNMTYFQTQVLEGIGVMIFDEEQMARVKGGTVDDDDDDDDDAEEPELPSTVDGNES